MRIVVVFAFSTLTTGIGGGLRSQKNMFNSAAFLRLSQVRSLWPLLVVYDF